MLCILPCINQEGICNGCQDERKCAKMKEIFSGCLEFPLVSPNANRFCLNNGIDTRSFLQAHWGLFSLWLVARYGGLGIRSHTFFYSFFKVIVCCPPKDYWTLKLQLWNAKHFIHPQKKPLTPAAPLVLKSTPLISHWNNFVSVVLLALQKGSFWSRLSKSQGA